MGGNGHHTTTFSHCLEMPSSLAAKGKQSSYHQLIDKKAQEGKWDPMAAARTVRIIAVEEAGLPPVHVAQDVPEISRIYGVKLGSIYYQPRSSRRCTVDLLKYRRRVGKN